LRGHIDNFLVSPDRKKIATAVSGALLIVPSDGTAVRQAVAVDSIHKETKKIGRSFFRDDGFQWSRDSKYLYLIKDEYYESKGSQLYSAKGELWRYDVQIGNLTISAEVFSRLYLLFW
jgi:hypothetical protein